MRTLIFIFLTFSHGLTLAQEESAGDNADEVVNKTEQSAETKEQKTEFETPDSFEASERLSEDVPAPFPVDI
ncbi:MAG: hypothetical protein GKR93_19210 [Gammaproteobacteria bacterium]|nr:hypothetical protein [Gammaproteobacteria bacterium]